MKKILIVTALICLIFNFNNISFASQQAPSGWYLLGGLNLGYGIQSEDKNGFIIGPEISISNIDTNGPNFAWFWYGFYGDSLWDLGSDSYRFSIGPEFGYGLLGIELGYLFEYEDNHYNHGTRIGIVFTIGFCSIYSRWGHFYNHIEDNNIVEIGVLLKWPVFLAD